MATRSTSRSRSTRAKSRANSGPVDRLDDAIAAAQDALKDLRGDLSRGRKALVKDVDKTLKDARGNLRQVRKTLAEDLDEVGRKLTGGAAERKPSAKPKAKTAAKAKPKAKAKRKA